MRELYGDTFSYDLFWSRPGLSKRDRSLITITALVAMGREEQTKIHMRGFLGSGGKINELREALVPSATRCSIAAFKGKIPARVSLNSRNFDPIDRRLKSIARSLIQEFDLRDDQSHMISAKYIKGRARLCILPEVSALLDDGTLQLAQGL